jgi:hypothetical protein
MRLAALCERDPADKMGLLPFGRKPHCFVVAELTSAGLSYNVVEEIAKRGVLEIIQVPSSPRALPGRTRIPPFYKGVGSQSHQVDNPVDVTSGRGLQCFVDMGCVASLPLERKQCE